MPALKYWDAVAEKWVSVGQGGKGDPGLSIASGTVNESGHLILTMSDSSTVDVGAVIGPAGDDGDAATITIGTVTTGAAGTDAEVTNSGTSSAAVLDFTIPQGASGSGTGDMLAATYNPIITGITGETTFNATPATTLKAIAEKRDVKTITICNPAADAISLKLPFKDAKTLYAVQLDSVKLTDATNPPTASSILVTPTGSTTIKIYGIDGSTVTELDSNAMTTASLLHTLSTPASIPADSWVLVKIVGAVNGIVCLSVGLVVG